MTRPPLTSGLAILAALASACGAEPASEPSPTREARDERHGTPSGRSEARIRVVLVGDSITVGLVSRPKGPSYAALLREQLGPDFEVVNLGCGGSSSLDWTRSRGAVMCGGRATLPRLYDARVLPALPAEFVTVLLGTNDSQGVKEERRIPPDEYGAALREIATNLLDDGAGRVVLLGPPLVAHKLGAMLRLVEYGAAVRALCDEDPRVLCGPDVRYLLALEDFAPGNVHPNGPGHAKIAAALSGFLRELAFGP